MSIAGDVAKELIGMFLADARLATAILLLVAGLGGLIFVVHIEPLVAGGILLVGCLAILVEAALRPARERTHP
jgi:hypothetical protein